MKHLQDDSQLQDLNNAELVRQHEGMELIPSENYASGAVLEALGTVFTNKYSEGFPGRRYYGGQANTDPLETIAIDRAKSLFKADHANVQPHSGAQANEAAYTAWAEPGDTIMGMELSHGGHLTHGRPGTFMAKVFNFERYGIKDFETGVLDYDAMLETAKTTRPKIILAGFTSYPRELDYSKFKKIADEVGAVLMADVAHIAGLIAAGLLTNPFDHGFHIVTTTTHKTLRGPRGGLILTKGAVGNPLQEVEKTIENLPTLVDRSVFPGIQGGPHMNVILAKAVALGEAATPEFKTYAQAVLDNAQALAKALMAQGFKLVTNGTDNHMVVADVQTSFGIDGKVAEEVLDKIGLTVNKNMIPNDTLPAYRPSGIRLGTPAITTRGMKQADMEHIAKWMATALQNYKDEAKLTSLRLEVTEFCKQFPLPSDV